MIFLNHIPKTAGTTFSAYLQELMPYRRILSGLSLMNSGLLGSVTESEALMYTPKVKLAEYDFVTGHFGERVRQARFDEAYSIVILREPVSRLRSILNHMARDPSGFDRGLWQPFFQASGRLDVADPEFIATFLRSSSMTGYLAPRIHDNVLRGQTFSDQVGLITAEAIAALNTYDLVVTETTFETALSFIRDVLGAPPVEGYMRMNAAEQFKGDTQPLDPDMAAQFRRTCAYEFQVYEAGAQLAAAQAERIKTAGSAERYKAAGRLMPKQREWSLDWSEPHKTGGWLTREASTDPVLAGRLGRILGPGTSFIDLPMARAAYELRALLWCADPSLIEHLRWTWNGQPVPLEVSYPLAAERHYVQLKGPVTVLGRAGLSRLAIARTAAQASEVWLMDAGLDAV